MDEQHQSTQTALRLIIRGRVQGVGYRQWAHGEAARRGLAGYVRNRSDGSVEALIVGHRDAVAAMVAACWRGPALSEVESITETAVDQAAAGPFAILQTV
jgi:acylphosphatase